MIDSRHHKDTNPEDALRDADLWADAVIEAAKRLDPPDEVSFLTEVIDLLVARRDETRIFLSWG